MNLNDLYEMRDPRDAYERDVANSTSGFGKDSQAYRTDGGANDENHALDQQSSTWYIRLNGKLIRDKQGNPYSFQSKVAANKAALTMQAKLFNKDKEFMLTTNPSDKVAEGKGDLGKALGQMGGGWSGWEKDDSSDPDIEKYWYDDGEGGYDAGGTIEHNLKTGEVTVNYSGDEYHGDDVNGTFKNIGDALTALRGLKRSKSTKAPNFDRLSYRSSPGPDDLRKTDRTGRKGTIGGGFANNLKGSIQANKGRLGPKGVLPEEQGVTEGYYDLNDEGMQPIDLSTNPSFKQIVNRYTQLVYQGHAGETSPEEDQEYDAIEQYVAKRFGEKGSAHLQKAGEVSYWGRDDKPYGRDSRSSNLGWPSMPGSNFRTTKAGKMHKQDAGSKKEIIGNRLGRHPEPMLPESDVDSDGYSVDHADSGEYDYEGDQAKDQLNTIVRAARRLNGMLDDNENMPEWVQMKITNAADYIDTAADYIESNQEPEIEEGERGRGRPPSNTQDTTPVTPGRVEKTATGIRHHADASRYGGTEPDDDEDDHLMSKSHISRLGKMTEPDIDEGWRETLGAAALTSAMALGAGGAQARVMPGDDPGINRLTGKPIATQQATDTAPTQSTSSINLAKPQAQYDVDTRILTYKGKQYKWNSDAQATGQGEVVTAPSIAVGSRSMGSTKVELNPNGTYTRAPANESQEKVGNMDADEFDSAMARLKQLAGAGPLKTVYDPTKRVYRNVPVAVQPKK